MFSPFQLLYFPRNLWDMRYENLPFVNIEDKDSDDGNDNAEGDDW